MRTNAVSANTRNGHVVWPDGKTFAFTVFDDTDLATLDNVPHVYALLEDLGFRTTKSVWPMCGEQPPDVGGSTCADPQYLAWVRSLQKSGFEIAFHGATGYSARREETLLGMERFKELFGDYPSAFANHSHCRESIYWGRYRVSGLNRLGYDLITRSRRGRHDFRGHLEGDPYFWGDVCRDKLKYVRGLVYPEINTLKACPIMPYHDPDRAYVNYWFASSEAAVVTSFNRCLAEAEQDRLEAEGGACIVYTHFAFGFYDRGSLDARFQSLMRRLSRKNGWFVPVSTLLDYLLARQGHREITAAQRRAFERRWLRHKILNGPS